MFETLLVQPIYNGFVSLIGIMPGGDVGLAIVAGTLLLRAVFYPAFTASIRAQMGMQAVQPHIDEINQKYKDNPQERARRTMELFKEHNVRPFAGFLVILVQLPVFFALYVAFFREGLPNINHELLYSFVAVPGTVSTTFFGILDILAAHSVPLAVVVFATQYAASHFMFTRVKNGSGGKALTPDREAMQSIQKNMMLYFMPLLLAGVSYSFPSGVGLYLAASNAVSLVQEWIVKKQGLASKN